MSEMIERVARILQDRDECFAPGEPLDLAFIEDAKAAIAAMREPTEAMGYPLGDLGLRSRRHAEFVWRKMIDAALA